MQRNSIIIIILQSVLAFIAGQLISIIIGILSVIVSINYDLFAGLAGLIVYLITSIITILIGVTIVLILNRKRILQAIIINILIITVYSWLISFLFLGNPSTDNNITSREVTAWGKTTTMQYKEITGFKLPESYEDLELMCESSIDSACILSFTMPASSVEEYIKQFGFNNGIKSLNKYNYEELLKQYIIHDEWSFDGYSVFYKGETALTENVDGVDYAGIGTKIIIAYKTEESSEAKIFLFHLD